VHNGITSAVQKNNSGSDRLSYIIMGGRWCDVSVLNVHALKEDNIYYEKCNFYEELESILDKFP
jgi:hypothetical protein